MLRLCDSTGSGMTILLAVQLWPKYNNNHLLNVPADLVSGEVLKRKIHFERKEKSLRGVIKRLRVVWL